MQAVTKNGGITEGDPADVNDELEPGTELLDGLYKITEFLNSGGFGMTYLAEDSLERRIVIKECFPGSFCRRIGTKVAVRSRAHEAELRRIVKSFKQEAKSLAKLEHANIVGIHLVFNDNDTAYMAMDYIEGTDLLDLIEDKSGLLTPENNISMLRKLINAMSYVHKNGLLHRDISPDNILLNEKKEPVLIDFGAARESSQKASRLLSALSVVKDGYSPQELYLQGSDQAASIDVYALGATFYHVIKGETPPPSQSRLMAVAEGDGDPYEPLLGNVEGYPEAYLKSIDRALAVLPKDRFQSMEDWLDMIDGKDVADGNVIPLNVGEPRAEAPKPESTADVEPVVEAAVASTLATEPANKNKAILLGSVAAAAIVAVGVAYVALSPSEPTEVAAVDAPSIQADVAAVAPAVEAPSTTETPAPAEAVETPVIAAPEVVVEAPVEPAAPTAADVMATLNPATIDDVFTPAPEAELVDPAPTAAEVMAAVEPSAIQDVFVPPQSSEFTDEIMAAVPPSAIEDVFVPETLEVDIPLAERVSPIAPVLMSDAPATDGFDPTQPLDFGPGVAVSSANGDAVPETLKVSQLQGGASVSDGNPDGLAQIDRATYVAPPKPEPAPVETAAAPLVVMPLVVEPEAVPAPAPSAEAEVLFSVVAPTANSSNTPSVDASFEGRWDVSLSIDTVSEQSEYGVFPRIVGVTAPEVLAYNPWIEVGQTIFSINGELVSNEAQVKELFLQNANVDRNDNLTASVLIRDGDALIDHQLALPAVRVTELENGTTLRSSTNNGLWFAEVTSLSNNGASGLQIGDRIISEDISGLSVMYPTAIEDILTSVLSDNIAEAEFVVQRGNNELLVTEPLTN
ncbi:serine/threonine-protein kinase [Litoreibacter roseus]|nr:serine/threonine-protein kinase [Litoreibacter roseus]